MRLFCLRSLALSAALALTPACGSGPEPAKDESPAAEPAVREGPPTARWDVVDSLRESETASYHASDGGGRAWLVRGENDPPVTVGTPSRFTIVYEAGPEGAARDHPNHFPA